MKNPFQPRVRRNWLLQVLNPGWINGGFDIIVATAVAETATSEDIGKNVHDE
jgi:hypothetical protein